MRFLGVIAVISVTACATYEAPVNWTVSQTTDPITGIKRCVVSAPDHVSQFSFTRVGSLYPFVEKNSELGLVVGVSSGGRFKVPPGDILWRIDNNPYRTLRASNTPAPEPARSPFDGNEIDQSIKNTYEQAIRSSSGIMQSALSGATAVGDSEAIDVLNEMLAGKSLIFRSQTAAPNIGLPTGAVYNVGKITADGRKPISIDASFRAGLRQCNIIR